MSSSVKWAAGRTGGFWEVACVTGSSVLLRTRIPKWSPRLLLEGRAKLGSLLPSHLELPKGHHSCLAMPPFHTQDVQAATVPPTLPCKPAAGLLRDCCASYTLVQAAWLGGHLKTTKDLQVLLCSPEFKILPCLDPRALPGFLDTKGLCTCCLVGPGCGQQPGKLWHTHV